MSGGFHVNYERLALVAGQLGEVCDVLAAVKVDDLTVSSAGFTSTDAAAVCAGVWVDEVRRLGELVATTRQHLGDCLTTYQDADRRAHDQLSRL
jgi:hypothetical protein